MSIRRASPADVPGIRRCLAAAFAPYEAQYSDRGYADTVPDEAGLRQRLTQMTVLIAEDAAGAVVGTIGYESAHGGVGHLRGMAVLPSYRGRGVAADLLTRAETDLAAAGCTRVTLDTTAPLLRAIAFYTRHGYQPTGVVGDFFGMPLFEYAKETA